MDQDEDEVRAISERIEQLKIEHRDLDQVIAHLMESATYDELHMRRLKRRKLLLKDQIALLERRLNPDIPA